MRTPTISEHDNRPLSHLLIRDLTAHRTLGLRLALGEQPDVALIAVTHTLAAQMIYRSADACVLDIRPKSEFLASHADGIEDTAAGKTLADRHAAWVGRAIALTCGVCGGARSGQPHCAVRALRRAHGECG